MAFVVHFRRRAVLRWYQQDTERRPFHPGTAGLYDYPDLGPVPAGPDTLAATLARKSSRLQSTGARAANALGLPAQIPTRAVYLTDGCRRTVQVGGQTIEPRHAEPRSLVGAGRVEGAVIQALR